MLPSSLLTIVGHLVVIVYITLPSSANSSPSNAPLLSFTAEHEFHLLDANIDLDPLSRPILSSLRSTSTTPIPDFALKARPTTVTRPRSNDILQQARLRSSRHGQCERVEWEEIDTTGPDIEDRHTLAQLARMTGNAYALPGQKNWYDVDPAWNSVCDYSQFRENFISFQRLAELPLWLGRSD
jgi:lipase ATG15